MRLSVVYMLRVMCLCWFVCVVVRPLVHYLRPCLTLCVFMMVAGALCAVVARVVCVARARVGVVCCARGLRR